MSLKSCEFSKSAVIFCTFWGGKGRGAWVLQTSWKEIGMHKRRPPPPDWLSPGAGRRAPLETRLSGLKRFGRPLLNHAKGQKKWPQENSRRQKVQTVGEAHPPSLRGDSLKNRDFDFLGVVGRRDKAGSTQLVVLRRLVKFQHQRTQNQKVTDNLSSGPFLTVLSEDRSETMKTWPSTHQTRSQTDFQRKSSRHPPPRKKGAKIHNRF